MKPIFRNAMFGFRKEDVASFIAEQSKMWEKRISETEEKIQEMKVNFQKEREELTFDNAALQALKEKQAANLATVQAIRDLQDELSADQAAFLRSVEESREILCRLQQELDRMKIRAAQGEEYRGKAQKFDQLAIVISGMVGGQTPEPAEISVDSPAEGESEDSSAALALENLERQEEAARRFGERYEKLCGLISFLTEEA